MHKIISIALLLTAIALAGFVFTSTRVNNPFSTEPNGSPKVAEAEVVELGDGDSYVLTASVVEKEFGNRTVKMLAYNGSIPGPFIKVAQGAEITLKLVNKTGIETTLHSHGLRLDFANDGTPGVSQDPIKSGDSFTYTLKFPDAGVYWYHPHIREDLAQELGLYGNYLVEPTDPEFWSPVNREVPLIVDDFLLENGEVPEFLEDSTNFAVMGRFGNYMMVNGDTDYNLEVTQGEVIRFYITNTSNARPYSLSIPKAKVKLVGSDLGRYERETFVDSVIINPAERYILEVYFPEVGNYTLKHETSDSMVGPQSYKLATFTAVEGALEDSYINEFNALRTNASEVTEMRVLRNEHLSRNPDKNIRLTIDMGGAMMPAMNQMMGDEDMEEMGGEMDKMMNTKKSPNMGGSGMMGMNSDMPIHWEDHMFAVNKVATSENITWKMIDEETGKENMSMNEDWTFDMNTMVKIRYFNDPKSMHPMQHPIHLHGQRFVVLAHDGEANQNMVWKDTAMVRVGETMDILVDMSNPGLWMSHCHIAEHMHSGMMMVFEVK